jgi:hypothetical protein
MFALKLMSIMSAVGFVIIIPACFLNVTAFLLLLFVGCFALFLSTAAVSVVILKVVPPQSRALAFGLQIVIIHVLGDVPSPVVVGLLKDAIAPDSMKTDGSDAYSEEGKERLRLVLMIAVSWLAWTIIFWTLAYHALVRIRRSRQERKQVEECKALLNFS